MIEWDVIRSDLLVGTHPQDASDIDTIAEETEATAILNLQHPEGIEALDVPVDQIARRARAHGLRYVRSPMRDFDHEYQRRTLPDATRALSGLLEDDHTVYVHCTAGINRSPLVVLGYLVFVEGMDRQEALRLIKRARPQARPYMDVLEQVREDIVTEKEEAIRIRASHIYQQNTNDSPDEDWLQAEREILAETLTP